MPCTFNINVNHNSEDDLKYFYINSSCKVYGFEADVILKSMNPVDDTRLILPFNLELKLPVSWHDVLDSFDDKVSDHRQIKYPDIIHHNNRKILIFSMRGLEINNIKFFYRGDLALKNIKVVGASNHIKDSYLFNKGIFDGMSVNTTKPPSIIRKRLETELKNG